VQVAPAALAGPNPDLRKLRRLVERHFAPASAAAIADRRPFVETERADERERGRVSLGPEAPGLGGMAAARTAAPWANRGLRGRLEQHPGKKTSRGPHLLESSSAAFLVEVSRSRAQWRWSSRLYERDERGKGLQGRPRIHACLERGDVSIEEERFPRLDATVRKDASAQGAGKKTSRHGKRWALRLSGKGF
jgi:hypothetical protein